MNGITPSGRQCLGIIGAPLIALLLVLLVVGTAKADSSLPTGSVHLAAD